MRKPLADQSAVGAIMDVDKRIGQPIADKNELASDWPINRWSGVLAAINRPLQAIGHNEGASNANP